MFERTSVRAVAGGADSLERYIKSRPSQRRLAWLREPIARLRARGRAALVRALYRRRGAESARRTAVRPDAGVDAVLDLVEAHQPRPEVLDALPFYYRQLFLGKSTINRAFWIGRERELAEAARAVARYRAGYVGALVVTGDRQSGKTSLCRALAADLFAHARVHHIFPPAGGSIEASELDAVLARELKVSGPGDPLLTVPEGSVMVFHDVELWWERSAGGLAVLEKLLEAVDRHGERCFFVLNLNVHALRFIDRLAPLTDRALAVIECGPMSAEQLKEILALRHNSTGMRFVLDERGVEGLTDWKLARFFTGFFDYSDGRVGTALQAWLAHIEEVDEKRLAFRRPQPSPAAALDALRMEQVALLLQFVLHKQLTLDRLARITAVERKALAREVATLKRAGLLVEGSGDTLEINRYVHHVLVTHLTERGLTG